MPKTALLLCVLLPLLSSCSTLNTHTETNANLSQYQHVFVEKILSDGYGVDEVIARELRGLGYDATSGPITMMPDNAEIVVIYDDHWTYDFSNYMIELDIIVETARTEKRLAIARYHRPSLGAGSTLAMVDTVLDKLFPAKTATP